MRYFTVLALVAALGCSEEPAGEPVAADGAPAEAAVKADGGPNVEIGADGTPESDGSTAPDASPGDGAPADAAPADAAPADGPMLADQGPSPDAFADSGAPSSPSAYHGTFLGGSGWERIQGAFIDAAGFIYVTGQTHSADFPVTANAYDQTKHGGTGGGSALELSDGFVAKLSTDGGSVLWCTFLGGSRRDAAYGVRTDSAGNVYVTGTTGSADFPTTAGAYDTHFDGPTHQNALSDVFVTSLSGDGGSVRWSTFVGGALASEETPRASITVDEAGQRIYIAGTTVGGTDFPTTANAYQPTYGGGGSDAFVFALSLDGSQLRHSTFFGGSGNEMASTAVAAHPDGSIYIAGATTSSDLATTSGAVQRTLKSGNPGDAFWLGDAFVARLSPALDQLKMATYYGGSGGDATSHNQGMTVNPSGQVVIVGSTSSTDLQTLPGAHARSLAGSEDIFVATFSASGSLVGATYLGGSNVDYPGGISGGADGRIYVSGGSASQDYPRSADAYQRAYGGGAEDIVLTVLTPGHDISYSTFVGGNGDDLARTNWIAGDHIIVGGRSDSADFPTAAPSAYPSSGGDADGVLFGFWMR